MTRSHLTRIFWLKTGLTVALVLGATHSARAQDPGASPKKPPNVLLIVDTSGSMEYEAGQDTFPTCNTAVNGVSERSRWIDVVEVLTGTINNYRCQSVDRASTTFTNLYRLPGSLNPPDYEYRNPYHRPLSTTCAPTPNITALTALTNAFDYVAPAFSVYDAAATSCTFSQGPDGLIDSFTGNLRFGLMTFDTLPDERTGYNGSYGALYADGIAGAWSYFRSAAAAGQPISCGLATPPPMEVGARNGAAPAWEGKLIHFGDPDASASDDLIRHSRVEEVLLSTRPYGATPIAGALTDAKTFLTTDVLPDPTSVGDPLHSTYYGPKNDPYVAAGCRDQYVILLTDGEPNLDLRPFCEGPSDVNGTCPYHRSETVASEMATLSGQTPIKTFVVGFAPDVTTGADATDCKAMVPADWALGGKCDAPSTEELRVCCTLHEIAAEGKTGKAYFGNDKAALRAQLSLVFDQIIAGGGSATQPVRSPGVGDAEGGTSPPVAFRVLTSYEPGETGVWRGTIERLRWTCGSTGVPAEALKDETKGDDFSFNVNSHPTQRTFMTYAPTAVSSVVHSNRSIRPSITNTTLAAADGIGNNLGAVVSGDPTAFTSTLPAAALMPDLTSGPCAGLTAATCKDRLVPWFVGANNGTSNHRCATPATNAVDRDCSVIGDVMHSTPVIVDHPTAEIEDETYASYRLGTAEDRPMMVYTSSNDGVLHAFKMSPNVAADPEVDNSNNNEIFAFVPPAILPLVDSQYPTSRQKLLDGIPVVQEVVATSTGSTSDYYGFRLERSSGNAGTASSSLTYRTILVQSFGGAQSGYFAMDITDPTSLSTDANTRPRMLWQLTTDSAGNPLFGQQGATPLITTLNVNGVETAVAVLPGGHASTSSGYCPRKTTDYSNIDTSYGPRWNVRCYALDQDNDGVVEAGDSTTYMGARSLTIVRLDNGQVITRFRRASTESPSMPTNVALLDSPITGTPAAYPAGTGAVADRIFVGDQDGTLWRVDTSNPDPTTWAMTLFFDTYAKHPDVGTPALAGAAGRPIVVAPTLSVNAFGQITVASATGDQDLSGGTDRHYVWSLKETFVGGKYVTGVNWYQPLTAGEHVLGPLRLNEGILYFSSFAPVTGNSCSLGTSTIWAMDYAKPNPSGLALGGYPRLSLNAPGIVDSDPTDAKITAADLKLPVGTIIFGVALEYVPTCFNESGAIASALLGGGHTTASGASASALQLAFQTSSSVPAKAGLGFKTGFQTVGLNRPSSGATIESWAAILE